MKLAVLGATGGSGLALVKEALEQEIHVVALVRTPSKLGALLQNNLLTVVQGDANNVKDVQQVVRGADALASCLGLTKSALPLV